MEKKGTLASPADGASHKRLARARWPDQQDPFGNPAPQFLKFLGVLQEFDDFLQLFLGFLGRRPHP